MSQPPVPPRPSPPTVVPLRRPVPVGSVQGTLALDLRAVCAEEGVDPPPVRVVADREAEHARLVGWAHRFVQAAVEVAGGDRPVAQLLRWTSPRVYDDLERRARRVRATVAHDPHAPRRVQQVRPHVASLHVCWLGPATAELSARVRYGHRSRAVAVRFEHRGGRWQAVALEL